MDVGVVPAALFLPDTADGPGARGVRLWLAPDASRARIALASRIGPPATPSPPAVVREWVVETPAAELGPSRELVSTPGDPAPGECQVDGWATPDAFVRVCLEPGTEQAPALVLHRLGLDDVTADVTIGTARAFDNHAWLIDGTAGVVYGWSPMEQLLYRVDVNAMEVATREIPVPSGEMHPIEASWPVGRGGAAAWVTGDGGRGSTDGGFVGSPDGSVLYAAGQEPNPAPLETISNGIYAFDADTLAVVGHWVPLATYDSLGITADGRYLMALGLPSPAELAVYGNVGPSMVLHDTGSGEAVAILRRIVTRLDGRPSFLVPRPAT